MDNNLQKEEIELSRRLEKNYTKTIIKEILRMYEP
jgi:hypothetical protein